MAKLRLLIQILANEHLGDLQLAGGRGGKRAALLARVIDDLRILLPGFTIEEGPARIGRRDAAGVEELRLTVDLQIRRLDSQGLTVVEPCAEGNSLAGTKTPAQIFPAQQYACARHAQHAGLCRGGPGRAGCQQGRCGKALRPPAQELAADPKSVMN